MQETRRISSTPRAASYVILATGVSFWLGSLRRPTIPAHLLNDAIVLKDLIDEPTFHELRALVRTLGAEGYALNTNDLKAYTTEHEHIGEAVPMPSDGKCADVFMVPSLNRTHCILPGRIDIGRHYVTTGGIEGLRESAQALTSRALSFGRYIFDLSEQPIVAQLFGSERFLVAARSICPASKPYLAPFQYNFILQVPGQTVPMHVDGVYFWGATRFEFPQWLLAVMLFSGAFRERFVHQVQVVGYLHARYEPSSAGEFLWWGPEAVRRTAPLPRSGTVVDGSRTVHAAAAYRPEAGPPPIDKDLETALVHVGEGRWELRAESRTVRTYSEDELRISIVYRAHCFQDADEAAMFHATLPLKPASHARAADGRQPPEPPEGLRRLSLDDVMATLRADLARRNKPMPAGLMPYEIAMRLLREYVRYPPPPGAWLPFNYCALGGLVPRLKPALRWVCATV